MKKIIFILPYFGKFNNYFSLFLKSCEYNKDIDWLIITDDHTQYDYPNNVIVKYIEFDELKSLIDNKFGFKTTINRPHKLCDFKPAYGYIFEEYISEYDFWGHCDCDVIFGDIRKFITNELLDKYDKLFCLGHCTLYKNTEEINKVFMNDYKGEKLYKKAYSSDDSFAFDEEYLPDNVNRIFKEYGYRVLEDDYSANVSILHSDFRLVRFDQQTRNYITEKKNRNVFVFNKGTIKRYQKKFHELIITDYMYIHLQRRKMDVILYNMDKYKIVSNRFTDLEFETIDESNFDKVRINYPNDFRIRLVKNEIKFWAKKIKRKATKK